MKRGIFDALLPSTVVQGEMGGCHVWIGHIFPESPRQITASENRSREGLSFVHCLHGAISVDDIVVNAASAGLVSTCEGTVIRSTVPISLASFVRLGMTFPYREKAVVKPREMALWPGYKLTKAGIRVRLLEGTFGYEYVELSQQTEFRLGSERIFVAVVVMDGRLVESERGEYDVKASKEELVHAQLSPGQTQSLIVLSQQTRFILLTAPGGREDEGLQILKE